MWSGRPRPLLLLLVLSLILVLFLILDRHTQGERHQEGHDFQSHTAMVKLG